MPRPVARNRINGIARNRVDALVRHVQTRAPGIHPQGCGPGDTAQGSTERNEASTKPETRGMAGFDTRNAHAVYRNESTPPENPIREVRCADGSRLCFNPKH